MGEGEFECLRFGGVDFEGRNAGVEGGEFDGEVDAPPGEAGEGFFAENGFQFGEAAGHAEGDFGLLAIDGGGFYLGVEGGGGGFAAAEAGHGMHGGGLG